MKEKTIQNNNEIKVTNTNNNQEEKEKTSKRKKENTAIQKQTEKKSTTKEKNTRKKTTKIIDENIQIEKTKTTKKQKEIIDNYKYELDLNNQGITLIAGVDEVGRGPLIGPVVAAAVILPKNFKLDGLTDSKKLSEKKREQFYEIIKKEAIAVGIGIISEKRIDEINIYEATKEAMKEAINNLTIKPEHILIDAMPLDLDIPTTSIIKGDLLSITISAASVIAKVTRDHMLYEIDKEYPMYDLKNNKGYGTKKHLEAIKQYGITKYHRLSFKPVFDNKDRINDNQN